MVSKKLILTSGLMIASISFTGCSGLQDMINNKIASTAKQVSDGVNSEVGKATDALKAQGEVMQKDTGIAAAQLKSEFGIVDGEVYKNTQFGFSLQFPKSWGKVTAKPTTDAISAGTKYGKIVSFSFENKAKTYAVVAVDKSRKGDLEGLEYSPLIGTSEKYKIFGTMSAKVVDGDITGEIDKEIEAINKSFKAL